MVFMFVFGMKATLLPILNSQSAEGYVKQSNNKFGHCNLLKWCNQSTSIRLLQLFGIGTLVHQIEKEVRIFAVFKCYTNISIDLEKKEDF